MNSLALVISSGKQINPQLTCGLKSSQVDFVNHTHARTHCAVAVKLQSVTLDMESVMSLPVAAVPENNCVSCVSRQSKFSGPSHLCWQDAAIHAAGLSPWRCSPLIETQSAPDRQRQGRQHQDRQQQSPHRRSVRMGAFCVNSRPVRTGCHVIGRVALIAYHPCILRDRGILVVTYLFCVGADEAAIKDTARQSLVIVRLDGCQIAHRNSCLFGNIS